MDLKTNKVKEPEKGSVTGFMARLDHTNHFINNNI